MNFTVDTSTAEYSTVTVAAANLAAAMASDLIYEVVSNTNALIRQGTALRLTPETFAALVDGETFTITVNGVATVYEIDKTGDGVTSGNVQVDISGETTAAEVGTVIAAAITTAQTYLTVVDNTGTVDIFADARVMTASDTVTDVTFAFTDVVLAPSAADGSSLLVAGVPRLIHGRAGRMLGILRATADGVATLTQIHKV